MFILFILDNKLYATGQNVKGNLGIGNEKNQKEFTPVDFFRNLEILKISCGSCHTIVQCSTRIKTLID
jgi:alpha-tubulin suppressor-like RCC1 family protein